MRAATLARICRVEVISLDLGPGAARLVTSTYVHKAECRRAREVVAAYHEARLIELVQRVDDAVDGLRAGELDAFRADGVIFRNSRAAKELWEFCNFSEVQFTASLIRERAPSDWWERGAPMRR